MNLTNNVINDKYLKPIIQQIALMSKAMQDIS